MICSLKCWHLTTENEVPLGFECNVSKVVKSMWPMTGVGSSIPGVGHMNFFLAFMLGWVSTQ